MSSLQKAGIKDGQECVLDPNQKQGVAVIAARKYESCWEWWSSLWRNLQGFQADLPEK